MSLLCLRSSKRPVWQRQGIGWEVCAAGSCRPFMDCGIQHRGSAIPSEGLEHFGEGSDFCCRTVSPAAVWRVHHRRAGGRPLSPQAQVRVDAVKVGRRGLNTEVFGTQTHVLLRKERCPPARSKCRDRSGPWMAGRELRLQGAEQSPKVGQASASDMSSAPSLTPHVPRPFGGRKGTRNSAFSRASFFLEARLLQGVQDPF